MCNSNSLHTTSASQKGNDVLVLVTVGAIQWGFPLGVPLVDGQTTLQEIFSGLLAAITSRIVQQSVALLVDDLGIGFLVHEQLQNVQSVNTDGIVQRRDTLVILGVSADTSIQKLLHGIGIAGLASLRQTAHGSLDLGGQASHLYADGVQESGIVVVLHDSLHAAGLHLVESGGKLRVVGQSLEHLGGVLVVLHHLSQSHDLTESRQLHGVLGGILHGILHVLGSGGVGLQPLLHATPVSIANAGWAAQVDGGTIGQQKGLVPGHCD
mmetsp:Transcript_49426/g.88324  ORF Transcript_49426/g.88324 Transcript_49426/m.88324 type:complete len:267 (-) Transcript_49426:65-865(-)